MYDDAKENGELRPTNIGNQPLLHTSLHFTSMYDDVVLSMRGEEWNSGFLRPSRKKTLRLLFNLFVTGL
jgi:hypothetical protein